MKKFKHKVNETLILKCKLNKKQTLVVKCV